MQPHILQCLEDNAYALKIKLITELKTWLGTIDTHEELKAFICHGLLSWINSTSYPNATSYDPNTQLAFNYQNLLGYESLLHGLNTDKIIQLQYQHYTIKTVEN